MSLGTLIKNLLPYYNVSRSTWDYLAGSEKPTFSEATLRRLQKIKDKPIDIKEGVDPFTEKPIERSFLDKAYEVIGENILQPILEPTSGFHPTNNPTGYATASELLSGKDRGLRPSSPLDYTWLPVPTIGSEFPTPTPEVTNFSQLDSAIRRRLRI